MEDDDLLKSDQVIYQSIRRINGVNYKKMQKKVKIGKLNDKCNYFSNGIMSLFHGHKDLEPLRSAMECKCDEWCQSDFNIFHTWEIEKAIIRSNRQLQLLDKIYRQNEEEFNTV